MITVYAKLSCGCCNAEMQFNDEQAAVEKFKTAGLSVNATIKDDTGIAHSGVDTFYGFSLSDNEQQERSLDYLMQEVGLLSGKTEG